MENSSAVQALIEYDNLLSDNIELVLQDFPEELILAFNKFKFPEKIATSIFDKNEVNPEKNARVALCVAFAIGYAVKGIELKLDMSKRIC